MMMMMIFTMLLNPVFVQDMTSSQRRLSYRYVLVLLSPLTNITYW